LFYSKKRIFFYFLLFLILGGLFFFKTSWLPNFSWQQQLFGKLEKTAICTGVERAAGELFALDHSAPQTILSRGIPLLREREKKNSPTMQQADFLRFLIYSGTKIDLGNLKTLLSSQIPLLAGMSVQENFILAPVTANPETERKEPEKEVLPRPLYPANQMNKHLPGEPLVAIYHSHTAESYLPWLGVTHITGGKRGNIVDVGNMLAKSLEEEQIKVVHSLAIHDYPTFRDSYRRSYVTASGLVKKYPSLKIIIDLHRDAGVKEKTVVQIKGKKAARILLDVGTDRLGLPHPNWRKNLALAQLVAKEMEEMYPGLCRGIIVANARYNQHLSPGAMLVEIGDQYSTKEEARESAYLCGKVIARALAKMP